MSNYSTEVLETIQYHDSCFDTYKKRAERYKPNPSDDSAECTNSNIEEVSVDIIKSPVTGSQSGSSKSCKSDDAVHICVICNCVKKNYTIKTLRISQEPRAWRFLAATNFYKDDVYRRTIFCKKPGNIFAADVHCHRNCIGSYFLEFDRDLKKVNDLNDNAAEEECDELTNVFDELCSTLDLDSQGYLLTECRNMINEKLSKIEVSILVNNRRLKNLLIDKYGNSICFTFLNQKRNVKRNYTIKKLINNRNKAHFCSSYK